MTPTRLWILALPLSHSVILDRSLKLAKPLFLHLQNGNNNAFFAVVLWEVVKKRRAAYLALNIFFLGSFIWSFSKHLLNSYTVPGTRLQAGTQHRHDLEWTSCLSACLASSGPAFWFPFWQPTPFTHSSSGSPIANSHSIPQFRVFHPSAYRTCFWDGLMVPTGSIRVSPGTFPGTIEKEVLLFHRGWLASQMEPCTCWGLSLPLHWERVPRNKDDRKQREEEGRFLTASFRHPDPATPGLNWVSDTWK